MLINTYIYIYIWICTHSRGAPVTIQSPPMYPRPLQIIFEPGKSCSKPLALRSPPKPLEARQEIPKSRMGVRSTVPRQVLGFLEIWEVHPGRQGQALCGKLDPQDVYPEWDWLRGSGGPRTERQEGESRPGGLHAEWPCAHTAIGARPKFL